MHWCAERLLWTTIIKDRRLQRYLLFYPFFLGFIGNSIVSTPCTQAFGSAYIILHFLRWLSLSQRWNLTPLPCVTKQALHFMRMCALWHYYARLLSELRPSNHYIKICRCVCDGSGMSSRRDWTSDTRALYLLYFAPRFCIIANQNIGSCRWRRRFLEFQSAYLVPPLLHTPSLWGGGSAAVIQLCTLHGQWHTVCSGECGRAEVDTGREQQLKQMEVGWLARLGLVAKTRMLKCTYVCSEERTVVRYAVLMQMEVRAQWTTAPQESCKCQTAHTGEWGGSSWSEWS